MDQEGQMKDRRPDALGDFSVFPDELVYQILGLLQPVQVGIMACVSSVFYIFCNEEPLWMKLCLENHDGLLTYESSWKYTTLKLLKGESQAKFCSNVALHFNGFSSLFLYRRWYRCNVQLDTFAFDNDAIERVGGLGAEDFGTFYDGKKPVLLPDLIDDWPAKEGWTVSHLQEKYGDILFKVSQAHGKKLPMKFSDYVSYMRLQHDEEPLYIFDSKFGETAPGLVSEYKVPSLFDEDLFSVLHESKRPPYRWIVIGPARSGASWHVDPALTSAWNSLLVGRKRWAFYPPGRVPPGVTVHVDEEDGDVDIDGPTSLQWWMDIYPFLGEEHRPLECTQLSGETIFVPSGWWHCVLNIDETVAVTQNFVNCRNLELVCLDMAPGYRHRAVARAGSLALLEEGSKSKHDNDFVTQANFAIENLVEHLKDHPDHFLSATSEKGYLSRSDLRDWLRKLWVTKKDLKERIWKCADMILDANAWLERLTCICNFFKFPFPVDEEQLPVGNGSSPVYLVGAYAIKFYLCEDLEISLEEVGSELEFYMLLQGSGSSLSSYVPEVVASGVLYAENGGYMVEEHKMGEHVLSGQKFKFTTRWSASRHRPTGGHNNNRTAGDNNAWPYLVTKRCPGENLAQCYQKMSREEFDRLASFLGEKCRLLHSLPLPPSILKSDSSELGKHCMKLEALDEQALSEEIVFAACNKSQTNKVSAEWQIFIDVLQELRSTLRTRLRTWDSLPACLQDQVEDYIPNDPIDLIRDVEIRDAPSTGRLPVWLHTDLMDDNIQMENHGIDSETLKGKDEAVEKIRGRYILDFGDVTLGDPLYELIPMHINVFQAKTELLLEFLKAYGLPFSLKDTRNRNINCKSSRISYRAMCYCLLYKYDALGQIFHLRKDLKAVNTWEELEEKLWGVLNTHEYVLRL